MAVWLGCVVAVALLVAVGLPPGTGGAGAGAAAPVTVNLAWAAALPLVAATTCGPGLSTPRGGVKVSRALQ
jgi:hypothetical protein